MADDSRIRRKLETVNTISKELKERITRTNRELSAVLKKIEALEAKITGWLTWLPAGIALVMLWLAGGQIYLLWHFWKVRANRTGG